MLSRSLFSVTTGHGSSFSLFSFFFGSVFLVLLVTLSTLYAQSPEKITPPVERTIYIPYDNLRTVFEQPGRGVFLDYDEFRELWNAARTGKRSGLR